MGGWSYDVENKQSAFTDTIYEIYGKKILTAEEGVQFYHPNDRELIWNSFNEVITKQKPYDLEVRLITAQGDNLIVRTMAEPLIEDGKVTHPVKNVTIAGNLRDIFQHLTPADDLSFDYSVNAPTVHIDGMTVAGQ